MQNSECFIFKKESHVTRNRENSKLISLFFQIVTLDNLKDSTNQKEQTFSLFFLKIVCFFISNKQITQQNILKINRTLLFFF